MAESITKKEELTEEQLRQYFFDGCLLLSDFLSPEELQQLRSYSDELEDYVMSPGFSNPLSILPFQPSRHMEKTDSQDRVLCRIENFVPHHKGLSALSETIGRVVGQIFHHAYAESADDPVQPACLFKEKINFKRPGGKGYAPHYDGPSPAVFGLATEFITAQLAIDEQTPENGCILGVFPRNLCPEDRELTQIAAKAGGDPDLDGRAGALQPDVVEKLPWRFIPAPAGSLFLFNHYFPHYSEGNKTDKVRRTAYMLYNSAEEGDFHEEHARLMADARAKFSVSPNQPVDWLKDANAIAAALDG